MGFYIPWLVDAARMAVAGTGKQVIAAPGWQTRGHGPMRLVEVVVGHHTGTPRSAAGDYPSYNVVLNGRSGLAGPLAQQGLGRSGNVYVFAGGLSYHAGVSAYAGYLDLNDEAVGIEAESAGDGTWTDDQLFMYPRLVAADLHYMRRGVDRYASHRTVARPAGRKPDPTGISDTWMRERATAFLTNKEADMPLTDDDIRRIWEYQIWFESPGSRQRAAGQPRYTEPHTVGEALGDTMFYAADAARKPAADIDEAALAALLAEALAARGGAGITPDQVADAMREVLGQTGLTVRRDNIETR